MPYEFPRCEILPLPDHQVSFRIDGVERLRWHFGAHYPRPFFYPLIGPSGTGLTRMGHPGDPWHDHHRSIWFAHEKVLGINFWGEQTIARIRQKRWLCYKDSSSEAIMAVNLGWFDGHDPRELLEQELIVAVRPGVDREILVELQSTFRPTAASLEFGKTNFGFLAVRVAKHVSGFFGNGKLTSSEGGSGESAILARPARWVDYSGPTPQGGREGITFFDHPANPGHPTKWHVREDGWMGAASCSDGPVQTTRARPLMLRYLLHVHQGECEARRAGPVFDSFAQMRVLEAIKSPGPHQAWDVRRFPAEDREKK